MKSAKEIAEDIVDRAGEAGGHDEVEALAAHGWPESRSLEPAEIDTPEVRAEIQKYAKLVLRAYVELP